MSSPEARPAIEGSPRPKTETVHQARTNLVKTSRSYGLYPVWDKEERLAIAFGKTKHDFALERLENAVRRDVAARIRRRIRSVEPSDLQNEDFLIGLINESARESKAANRPPYPKIIHSSKISDFK